MHSKIANRYAKSLLQLAVEQGKLETIKRDMDFFVSVLNSRDFVAMLKSPVINEDKKSNVVNKLFSKKIDELTLAFLNIMIRKKREAFLPDVAYAFEQQHNEHKGILTAKIITAVPANEAFEKKIKTDLKNTTHCKEVVLEKIVDENIIGGFVLKYEDKQYDASISNKLREIEKQFSNKNYNKQI